MVKTLKIRQLMPGSGAQSPVRGKGHPKIKIRVHLVWTAYSIANAKFMAPQKRQPPIPTENAGSSNKPARQAPKTKRGLKATIATKSPDRQTQEGKRNPSHIQSVNVVNTTQIAHLDQICTLRDDGSMELAVPQYKLGPVTFNRRIIQLTPIGAIQTH